MTPAVFRSNRQHEQGLRVDRIVAWTAAIGLIALLAGAAWDWLTQPECRATRVGQVVELRVNANGEPYCYYHLGKP